jgi:hypothetical protein
MLKAFLIGYAFIIIFLSGAVFLAIKLVWDLLLMLKDWWKTRCYKWHCFHESGDMKYCNFHAMPCNREGCSAIAQEGSFFCRQHDICRHPGCFNKTLLGEHCLKHKEPQTQTFSTKQECEAWIAGSAEAEKNKAPAPASSLDEQQQPFLPPTRCCSSFLTDQNGKYCQLPEDTEIHQKGIADGRGNVL